MSPLRRGVIGLVILPYTHIQILRFDREELPDAFDKNVFVASLHEQLFAALKHDFRTGVFDETYALLARSVVSCSSSFKSRPSCRQPIVIQKVFDAPIRRRRVPK